MPNETTQQGASATLAEPKKEKAFPDPGVIAQKKLDMKSDSGDDGDSKPMSLRDEAITDIEARIDAVRMAEIAKATEEYDGAMEEAQQIDDNGAAEEGLQSKEPMHEEPEPGPNDHLPEEYRDDPLADFIVMDEENDTPMFVTKVDGQERYIPLDKARQELQKRLAGDQRLAQAAEAQRQLEAREAQVRANELALDARFKKAQTSPPPEPSVPDVSDQDLENEAREVVGTLFTGTEAEAVEGLTKLLASVRRPATPAAPQIDPNEIVNQATLAAEQRLRQQQEEQDAVKGLKSFGESYPNLMADEQLFLHADTMTEVVQKEWKAEGRTFMPSDLMMEAGKRTQEWLDGLKGSKTEGNPDEQPANDRLSRKRKLRPMPRSNSQRAASAPAEEPTQTPQDAVAEMRKARGQAV